MDKTILETLRETKAVLQAWWVALIESSTEAATADSLAVQATLAKASTQEMEHQRFQHEHPLFFNAHEREGFICVRCHKYIFGASFKCIECEGFYLHESCAKLSLVLHRPWHSKHPLILFDEGRYTDHTEYSKCVVCKEFRHEYNYYCTRCDFNVHYTCASLPSTMKAEVHNHPLTLLWKPITFSCDLCGKEGKGVPYLCGPCGFCIHISCAAYLRKVKVVRHKHPLNLIYYLEVLQFDSRFCQLCVQKVDTNYGLYYCSRCDFVAHLNCAMDKRNIEELNMLELKDEAFTEPKTMFGNEDSNLNESVDSATYKVIKTNVGKDEIEIATEIRHFSHEHDLKLIDEVHNNEKCNGCIRAILPPFYSCIKCSFFLHRSCVELPKKKRNPLHRHLLTLLSQTPWTRNCFQCASCNYLCNGFIYGCVSCKFFLDVQCGLVSDILTHKGHEHQLFLAITSDTQSCSNCGSKRNEVFRCTTCEFALDFKCTTLPLTTRYEKHEHPFTLCYTAEDDSGEYYCDICEEKRDPNQWFYYCAECSYPAHPKCIIEKYPNCKFGGAYTFFSHPHPLTFVEETKDHPPCDKCREPCEELFYQCTQCNLNFHGNDQCLNLGLSRFLRMLEQIVQFQYPQERMV